MDMQASAECRSQWRSPIGGSKVITNRNHHIDNAVKWMRISQNNCWRCLDKVLSTPISQLTNNKFNSLSPYLYIYIYHDGIALQSLPDDICIYIYMVYYGGRLFSIRGNFSRLKELSCRDFYENNFMHMHYYYYSDNIYYYSILPILIVMIYYGYRNVINYFDCVANLIPIEEYNKLVHDIDHHY